MECKDKVLLIVHDRKTAAFLTALLSRHDYATVHASSAESAIYLAASHAPDAVLLDPDLPDGNGYDVLRQIREWSDVPILFISARQEEKDKVEALDGGANDYIVKPFGGAELMARIRAAIRTARQSQGARRAPVFVNGGLSIGYEKRAVAVDGDPVHLTPIEYRIVALLSQNVGKVMTHEFILASLWGPFAGENQVLRVNIANIRKKIEKKTSDPLYIRTEAGVGYRMPEIPAR